MARSALSLLMTLMVAGCGASSTSSVPPGSTAPRSASADPVTTGSAGGATGSATIDGRFDVGGYRMWIGCRGTGSPTVVFDAGLGDTGSTWSAIQDQLATTTQVCTYDRAGLGGSDRRPDALPRTVGAMAGELWRLLAVAGLRGPFVLAGHSYGGMIARLVAHDHPDSVRGLVLVDAATLEKFQGEWLVGGSDGAAPVDRETSVTELATITTLGDIPVIVLTQGQMSGDFVPWWSGVQDELAGLSTNSLHMVARTSNHDLPANSAGLIVASTRTVVDVVRAGGRLPSCGPAFVALGAECLGSTMTAQVQAWQRLRSAVRPVAGPFPAGEFRSKLLAPAVAALTGGTPNYQREVLDWAFGQGRWTATVADDGGSPDTVSDIYQADPDGITIRLPEDWTIPRTPGVNRLAWRVDGAGAIHLTQLDHELPEPFFSSPLVPVQGG